MHISQNTKGGQSLLEILFAVVIFTIGVVTIGYLLIDSHIASRQNLESTKAMLIAREGIEAVRAMRDQDFDALVIGTHGLSFVDNVWELASSSDADGVFIRSIDIRDVDPEIKKVVSTVSWNLTPTRPREVTLTTYLADWKGTKGNAGGLIVDVSSASLASSSDALEGIVLQNGDTSEDITITRMSVAWEGVYTLHRISIAGVDVFSDFATSSGITSGEIIDIADYTLPEGGAVHPVDSIGFSGDMSSTDFIITFIMSDGSRKYMYVTT